MFLLGYMAYAQLESIDIGNAVDTPGSTKIENGTYTIMGDGDNIWDVADGFRFVYTTLNGNFEAKVHLVSFKPVHEWSSTGIMARQSVDADAVNIIAEAVGESGAQITWRPSKGAETSSATFVPPDLRKGACWIKLTREGDRFHGYISKDGKEWEDLESQGVKMPKVKVDDPILVGLAVTSSVVGILVEAVFDNFTITKNGKEIFSIKPKGKLSSVWGQLKLDY